MSLGEETHMKAAFPRNLFRRLPAPLVDWFRKEGRPLPWRIHPDPYRVWLSEIMLQQTRIETVRAYYDRFLREIPDIPSLAAAEEERVLKLWEGLGYYSRARNLHAAAKRIMEHHRGRFPDTIEEIRALPGIGDYTAGAIASIAFGLPEPAVDGNVMRVIARLAGFEGDIRRSSVRATVAGELRKVYPADDASAFTQALMELGELLCLPNGTPLCARCPCAGFCEAAKRPDPGSIPARQPKKARPVFRKTVLILKHGSRIALRKRPPEGLLAGLWEFPSVEGWRKKKEVSALLNGLPVRKGPSARHVFSHVEWDMISWTADCPEECGNFVWFESDELPAVPSAFRAFRPEAKKKRQQKR